MHIKLSNSGVQVVWLRCSEGLLTENIFLAEGHRKNIRRLNIFSSKATAHEAVYPCQFHPLKLTVYPGKS